LTDFDGIWLGDAKWNPTGDRPLKFRIFQKPRWRRPPSWKITNITISLPKFDRSLQNLVRQCKMGLLTAPTIKNLECHKSKMADGRHFEKPLSLYLSNRLIDFDEIWQDDANWPPARDRQLKFGIFQKPRWRRPPSWKITKIAVSPQPFDRF